MGQVLSLPAKTFFVLLNEGAKGEVHDTKRLMMAAAWPHMEKDDQERIQQNLQLPEDILNDMIEEESGYDDIADIKKAFEE